MRTRRHLSQLLAGIALVTLLALTAIKPRKEHA